MKRDFYSYNINAISLVHYNKVVLYIELLKYFNNIVSNNKHLTKALIKPYYFNYNKSLGNLDYYNINNSDYFNIYNNSNNVKDIITYKLSYNLYFNMDIYNSKIKLCLNLWYFNTIVYYNSLNKNILTSMWILDNIYFFFKLYNKIENRISLNIINHIKEYILLKSKNFNIKYINKKFLILKFFLNYINIYLYNLKNSQIYNIFMENVVYYKFYKRYLMKDVLRRTTKRFIKTLLCKNIINKKFTIDNKFYLLKYYLIPNKYKKKRYMRLFYFSHTFVFFRKLYTLLKKVTFKYLNKPYNYSLHMEYINDIWVVIIKNFKFLLFNINNNDINSVKLFIIYNIMGLYDFKLCNKNEDIKIKKNKKISLGFLYRILKWKLNNKNIYNIFNIMYNSWKKKNSIINKKSNRKAFIEEWWNTRDFYKNDFINKTMKYFKLKLKLNSFMLTTLKCKYNKKFLKDEYYNNLIFFPYFEKTCRLINNKFQRIKQIFKLSYKRILYNIYVYNYKSYAKIKMEGKKLYAKRNTPNEFIIKYYIKLYNYLPMKLQFYLCKWTYLYQLKEEYDNEMQAFYKERQKYRYLKRFLIKKLKRQRFKYINASRKIY